MVTEAAFATEPFELLVFRAVPPIPSIEKRLNLRCCAVGSAPLSASSVQYI